MKGIIWYTNRSNAQHQLTELIAKYNAINIPVKEYKRGITQESVQFENGDFWKTCQTYENSKGNCCNVSLVERSIDPEFYETVIIRVTRALPYHAIGFYGE